MARTVFIHSYSGDAFDNDDGFAMDGIYRVDVPDSDAKDYKVILSDVHRTIGQTCDYEW